MAACLSGSSSHGLNPRGSSSQKSHGSLWCGDSARWPRQGGSSCCLPRQLCEMLADDVPGKGAAGLPRNHGGSNGAPARGTWSASGAGARRGMKTATVAIQHGGYADREQGWLREPEQCRNGWHMGPLAGKMASTTSGEGGGTMPPGQASSAMALRPCHARGARRGGSGLSVPGCIVQAKVLRVRAQV